MEEVASSKGGGQEMVGKSASKQGDQSMKADGAGGQQAPTKQALFDEAKFVFDVLDKLDLKGDAIPDVIFLLSSAWFNKWK